ncbi:hypothetical protein [Thermodesulfatator autotrophicus]|uniref:Uncharacterized protein n=1 Tax=Thermodesulfatator autotrophicus TaxID=1795632 RepID=A0A177E8D0_9BACT|nr:hypothetical protein [Thermodesulfatator autotrophicus]OAG28213.1 hypothetical protein TH606_02890 [Thermodesulfatator autotrophicus]
MVTSARALSNFENIVTKNIFSPSRHYVPYLQDKKPKNVKKELVKRYVILKGTLIKGEERVAVLEVLPAGKRELGLEDVNQKRLLVSQGDDLGNCQVLEVKAGQVVLGGQCQGVVLSLKDSPERKKIPALNKKPANKVLSLAPRPALGPPEKKTKTFKKPPKFPRPPSR